MYNVVWVGNPAILTQWENENGAGIPVWFYILRPFVFSDWTRIPGLHQDCKGIMDCVIIVSGLWLGASCGLLIRPVSIEMM